MSITRKCTRSGELRYIVEWRLPDRSKRRRTFLHASEAKDFEAEVRVARSRGVLTDPRSGKISLRSAYLDWLESRPDLSAKVRRGYMDCYRLRVDEAFGSWPVNRIDRASIQIWVNEMATVGLLGPRTQRWTHSVLRMVLEHCLYNGWLRGKNPAASTKFPPLPRTSHVFLTAPQVDDLATLCGKQGDVVLILAYTGLRFGELMGLNVEDIDCANRRVRVRRSITQVGGKLTESLPKSQAGYRSIPIPNTIMPLLESRIENRDSGEPAITSPRGARLGRENWVRSVRWKTQTNLLGFPHMRIHDLRHTYASLARSAGADLRLLQKTMGHASITVTAHTYADLYDDDLDKVAEALDSLRDVPPPRKKKLGPL